MTELKNDRYLRALLRQPVDVTPVWMMRQAGRYLPEYKATRAQAGDFMSLCKNAELACEVTLQPLRRYPLDAAILFSDILTIPDAMGLGLYFEAGEGPRFTSPVKSKADVDKLPVPDPEQELGYVMNAVRTIRLSVRGEWCATAPVWRFHPRDKRQPGRKRSVLWYSLHARGASNSYPFVFNYRGFSKEELFRATDGNNIF